MPPDSTPNDQSTPDRSCERYARQMRLPGIGSEGQARLARAQAVIVGCGALGCVTADHLARAGVARLRLIDRDLVERTNLQRQSLFTEADAAESRPKAAAAAARLAAVNSGIELSPEIAHLDATNADRLLAPADPAAPFALIDATDNFQTRYLLNDFAVRAGIAWIHAGVIARHGSVAAFVPGSACLRCFAPDAPAPGSIETCETAGVLAPAVGVAASLQSSLALDWLLGRLDAASAPTISFNLDAPSFGSFHRTRLQPLRDPGCPCCAAARYEFLDADLAEPTLSLCGTDAVQILPAPGSPPPNPDHLADRLAGVGEVRRSLLYIRATLPAEPSPVELTIFRDGRAILRGVREPARARALYDRYLG